MESHHFQISFKIEPKPGGGFVARSDHHPEPIEGATREEVQQKLRDLLVQLVGPDIAGKIPLDTAASPEEARNVFNLTIKKTVTTSSKLPSGSQPALPSSSGWQTSFSGPIKVTPENAGALKFVAFAALLLLAVIIAYALSR